MRTLALAIALATGSAAQSPPAPNDAELRKLGALVHAYFEARDTANDVDETRAAAMPEIERMRALVPSATLGRALELARPLDASVKRDGKVVVDTLREGSFAIDGLEYAYRLPKDYDAAQRYPLLLAIPDHDEKPDEHIRANWTFAALRDGAIVVSPAMPAERADWTRVSVRGKPGGLCHALTVLRIARERFACDVERIYVAGRGKGVPAAIACGNYGPQLFAGVIGRAGDAGELAPDNFVALPVLFAGGGARASEFAEAAKKLAIKHVALAPAAGEAEIWKWMSEHTRPRAPARISVVPGDPFPTRAYWMRVAPSASDARVNASIERDANTVRIAANGVSGLTLYLNDELVQLFAPLRVVVNDVEQSFKLAPSAAQALELLYDGTSDTSTVYVARVDVDLTGRSAEATAARSAYDDEEFRAQFAKAGNSADALWGLHLARKSQQQGDQAALVLAKLVRVAPDHAEARAALGHERSGALWFESREKRERYERGQQPAEAASRGYVEQKGVWMHPEDRARLGKGLVRDHASGLWLGSDDRERLAKGWVRSDLEWIEPAHALRAELGQWRVDGEWLELAEADRRHAAIDSPWRIPTREILLTATTPRAVALRAIAEMERALDDLRRVYGAEPELPLEVALMRDEEQYDRFAFGDPDGKRRATHTGRLHTIHYGFFAESLFPLRARKAEFAGQGVGYWDTFLPNGDAYGVHSARFACGLSYGEALDPSPKAVRARVANKAQRDYFDAYQAEKRMPAWLRYGAAVYAERFFRDTRAGEGGDEWWARKWSLENLASLGGFGATGAVFALKLDPDARDASRKLLLEAGLVVAFMVDGECAPVREAHAAFKRALASGRLHANDIAALEAAVTAHEAELKAFAGGR